MMFALGFLCGIIAEFVILMVIAANINNSRDMNILGKSQDDIDNNNK